MLVLSVAQQLTGSFLAAFLSARLEVGSLLPTYCRGLFGDGSQPGLEGTSSDSPASGKGIGKV